MKFKHAKLNDNLDYHNHIAELIIESPVFMREMVTELSAKNNCEFAFIDDSGHTLSLASDVYFVDNPTCLDFSNKQATTALIKLLAKASVSEDYYLSTNTLKAKIISYINEIVDNENFIFEVETDDFSVEDIARAVGVHVVGDEDDFVELLTDFMSMMSELARVKVFVFLNLRLFLTNEELMRLVKNVNNHELNILLIEGKDFGKVVGTDRMVIDADLCEI